MMMMGRLGSRVSLKRLVDVHWFFFSSSFSQASRVGRRMPEFLVLFHLDKNLEYTQNTLCVKQTSMGPMIELPRGV